MSYSISSLKKISLKTLLGEYPGIFNGNVDIISSVIGTITDGSALTMPLVTDASVSAQEIDCSIMKVSNSGRAVIAKGSVSLTGDASISGDVSVHGTLYFDSSVILNDVSIGGKVSMYGISDLDASVLELIDDVSTLKAAVSGLTTSNSGLLSSSPNPMLMAASGEHTEDDGFIASYSGGMNSYTYPAKIYSDTQKKDSSIYVNASDYYDIINGDIYRYYAVTGDYTKVNNKYDNKLHAACIGQKTNIILGTMVDGNPLRICLDKTHYIEATPDAFPLLRMELICTGISKQYGSTWYLLSYSGDLLIKTK